MSGGRVRGAVWRAALLALLLATPAWIALPAAAQAPPGAVGPGVVGSDVAGPGAAPAVPSAAPEPKAGVAVGGPVGTAVLDAAALAALPQTQAPLMLGAEHGPGTRAVFEGPTLWAVLERAGVLRNVPRAAKVRAAVLVTGRDGYAVVLSLGEIAPDLAGRPAVLALRMDGRPLPPGGLRLVLPGEARAGRSVRDVATVAVTLLGAEK